MQLVEKPDGNWVWEPRAVQPAQPAKQIKPAQPAKPAEPAPVPDLKAPVINPAPIKVVDTASLTISEFFGSVASRDSTASFALATVHRAIGPWEVNWQAPRFAEYVIVNEGSLELHTVHANGAELTKTHVAAGQGVYLPAGLRVKWSWPEPCKYTVVCVPAFSPLTSGNEPASAPALGGALDRGSRRELSDMHRAVQMTTTAPRYLPLTTLRTLPKGIPPLVVAPVAVVDAPGITIFEHFGNVASSDATASLGRAVVKGPSQEAWQAPQFDEYVVCTKGAVEFHYGDGQQKTIRAGQGAFLPRHLRVKWVWPEATEYAVLCLPAFTPEGCGREAEENATNAKDSASMARLQKLHEQKAAA